MLKQAILSTIFSLLAFNGFSQTLTKQALCKKWQLEKYVIFWTSYNPEPVEKNDFIELKANMTYQSMDEGQLYVGKWSFDASQNYFVLDGKGKNSLKFKVEKISADRLVVEVDDKEMDGVTIHFSTRKK